MLQEWHRLFGSGWPPTCLRFRDMLADHLRLQVSFVVPLMACAHVAFYGWSGHQIERGNQAI